MRKAIAAAFTFVMLAGSLYGSPEPGPTLDELPQRRIGYVAELALTNPITFGVTNLRPFFFDVVTAGGVVGVGGGGGGVSWPLSDETFKLKDDGDATKIYQPQLSGITTGNTIRPAWSGTATAPALTLGSAQVWWDSGGGFARFRHTSGNGFMASGTGTTITGSLSAPGSVSVNGWLQITGVSNADTSGLGLGSAMSVEWTSAATGSLGGDTGLARGAAGVVDVTNGTTGAGSLRIRNGGQIDIQDAGGGQVLFSPASGAHLTLRFASDAGVGWESGNAGGGAPDVGLTRSAAGFLRVTDGNTGRGVLNVSNIASAAADPLVLNTGTGNDQRDYIEDAAKTLTESTATAFVRIAVNTSTVEGGVIHYMIEANDATDFQVRTGQIYFSVVNKAGTETCVDPTEVGTSHASVSAGTLTVTWDCDETPTNAVDIRANAVSSLTQTTLRIKYRVMKGGVATVTPQ